MKTLATYLQGRYLFMLLLLDVWKGLRPAIYASVGVACIAAAGWATLRGNLYPFIFCLVLACACICFVFMPASHSPIEGSLQGIDDADIKVLQRAYLFSAYHLLGWYGKPIFDSVFENRDSWGSWRLHSPHKLLTHLLKAMQQQPEATRAPGHYLTLFVLREQAEKAVQEKHYLVRGAQRFLLKHWPESVLHYAAAFHSENVEKTHPGLNAWFANTRQMHFLATEEKERLLRQWLEGGGKTVSPAKPAALPEL